MVVNRSFVRTEIMFGKEKDKEQGMFGLGILVQPAQDLLQGPKTNPGTVE